MTNPGIWAYRGWRTDREIDSINRAAVYVIRMHGGVGGALRDAPIPISRRGHNLFRFDMVTEKKRRAKYPC